MNMHQNYPYSSQDLSSLGVYGSNEYYDQLGSWYNPRTWFKKKKKSKPLFWDTGVDIAEGVVKSDLAKKTGKTLFNKVADSNMEVTTTTNTTVNGKKSPTRTTKRNTTPRKEWSSFTSFFGSSPVSSLSSLGVYDPTESQEQFGSWYNPTTWFGGKKKKGKGKGKASPIEDLAKKAGKQASKAATDELAKKATKAIKKQTGIDVSAKDITTAAKDLSKGKVSKSLTDLGTKTAGQLVSKYGAQASDQLSQLTDQYTSSLNVPEQNVDIGSKSSALILQKNGSASTEDYESAQTDAGVKDEGLSTGAIIGIGVGVLGILGVGGYLLWSAKANKSKKADGGHDIQNQHKRAIQYQNLQAINNPKSKKAKKSKAKKSKARTQSRR